MRRVISVLLQNETGSLARVIGLFAARGYNIDSLTVAATHDPSVSRLTMVTAGDDAVIDQIIKQSRKLVEVIEVADLTGRKHLECALLMVKVGVPPGQAHHVADCVRRRPGAALYDESETTLTVHCIGNEAELDTFLIELTGIAPVLELARTGTAALDCGAKLLVHGTP